MPTLPMPGVCEGPYPAKITGLHFFLPYHIPHCSIHHRLAAGLELFGPDYEVAVEIVPFAGENNLMDAITYENSIHRNQLAHCHEMVVARREWWDEKVFNDYPTWEAAVEDRRGYFGDQTAKNRSLVLEKLESWFRSATENGPGNYAKSFNYGIGRIVLAKMLKLNEGEVQEAL